MEILEKNNYSMKGWVNQKCDLNSNNTPKTHFNIGQNVGISLTCIPFTHLPLLGPTNMAADGFNICGLNKTGRSIQSLHTNQWLQLAMLPHVAMLLYDEAEPKV